VPITGPDGTAGTITVNASDENAAVENASQGGNTATGGATQVDAGPNAQTSSLNMTAGGGGNAYNTGGPGGGGKATVGNTKADPGTAFSYGAGSAGGSEADRTKSIYEGKEGETLQNWMDRVFRQSTRDFGGVLSPDANNPYGRTPYAQWFQNRYSDVVPANIVLGQLLGNTGSMDNFAGDMESGMKAFQEGGVGRGLGINGQSQQNLGELNDLLNSFMSGNTEGLSPVQRGILGQLNDSPNQQAALINAQLSGGLGANPFASTYVKGLQSRMLNDYYDDVVGQAPNKNGSYLQNFMKTMGMA
jgi:hypothetical protein